MISKFDDAEKVKLSDEESQKIDDKYQSMRETAERDIAALEARVQKTKERADWFRQQRKLEAQLKNYQDQVDALIEDSFILYAGDEVFYVFVFKADFVVEYIIAYFKVFNTCFTS